MTTKQILSDFYDYVVTKMSGERVLNVYKAKGIGELPKSLLDDYAKPESLCVYQPVRGLRYSTGNPDWGEWDAQVVLVAHGSVVDLYVCAILVRPFSEEARQKYETMTGQLPQKRVALLWDSREYDEVHGYERIYTVAGSVDKPKKVNKRPRATLRQVRALQEEKKDLEIKVSELESTVSHTEELRKRAFETEQKNVELSERVKSLTATNNVLNNSNDLMEKELKRLRIACNTLNELNDEKSSKIVALENRGFWARVFNKK